MCRYENIRFVLISPEELKLPGYVKYDVLEKSGFPYEEVTSLEEAMPKLDVLYMTRIQRERFSDQAVYERLKDSYILDTEKMKLAKEKMCVLHPLPRVNEISVAVDDDPRAAYFRQALNGKYMRMALILKLLKQAQENPAREPIRGELRYDLAQSQVHHPDRAGAAPDLPPDGQSSGHPPLHLLRAYRGIKKWDIPLRFRTVYPAFCLQFSETCAMLSMVLPVVPR